MLLYRNNANLLTVMITATAPAPRDTPHGPIEHSEQIKMDIDTPHTQSDPVDLDIDKHSFVPLSIKLLNNQK